MRVTNGMIRNTTLNGLYSNMNTLNKTYAQMATGKKIQTVSDDPIIAGRALKFKTTVLETTQYESNAKEAMSWMEVTESSLSNMNEILTTIRNKVVQAANGPLEKSDKNILKIDIMQLWKQIQKEANTTYGGRYIFSGYKTNTPLVLTEQYKVENKDLNLTDEMVIGDSTTLADGSILKSSSKISEGSILGKGTIVQGDFTLGVGSVLSKADAQKMLNITLEEGKYFFDQSQTLEAGTELTKEQVIALKEDLGIDLGMPADYAEKTFKLENAVEVGTTPTKGLRNEVSKALFGLEGSADTYTTTVKHSKANYTIEDSITVGAGHTFNGEITCKGKTVLQANSTIASGSTLSIGSIVGKDTLNPEVQGAMENHHIQYEIGVNSTMDVNVTDMDTFLENIANCLNEIFTQIEDSLKDESITNLNLSEMLTSKLDEIDDIMQQISQKTSDLGSRMSRLEYTQKRLNDQKTTFKNLLSETEDVDIEEVYTNFNVQYATYQSALQATSKIITNTLADYL